MQRQRATFGLQRWLARWRAPLVWLMVAVYLSAAWGAPAPSRSPSVVVPIQTASPPNACSILPSSGGGFITAQSNTVLCQTANGGTVQKSATPTAGNIAQFVKGFVAGLLEGLWQQISGLWGLVTNPGPLWQLAKDLANHPEQTLKAIAKALGKQFATVTQIKQELVCEPYSGGQTTGVLLVTMIATADGEGVANDLETIAKITAKTVDSATTEAIDLTVVNIKQEAKTVGEQLANGQTVIVKDLKALSNKAVGDLGEGYILGRLKQDGFTDIIPVQNASGHGNDIIAHNPSTGYVKVIEVKSTTDKNATLSLSSKPAKDGISQKSGGAAYTQSRLNKILNNPNAPADLKAQAAKAMKLINLAKDQGKLTYKAQQVILTQSDGGVVTAVASQPIDWIAGA